MSNYQQIVNKSILYTFVIDYEEQNIIYDFPGIPGIPGNESKIPGNGKLPIPGKMRNPS